MGDLAIIIVTYNSGESIGRLLRSIAPAYPGGSPRVIVVDCQSVFTASREDEEVLAGVF